MVKSHLSDIAFNHPDRGVNNMRLKGQGRKEYIVIRQEFDVKPWDGQPDEQVVSLPMTEKRAVEAVLHYERLGYFKVDYQKVSK